MAVRAVLAEGDDDVGPEVPDGVAGRADQNIEVGIPECAVHVVETVDALDAEDRARAPQLLFPHGAEDVARGRARIADLASLAAGGREHHGLRAARGVLRQRSACDEDLIIGMGEDAEDPYARRHRHRGGTLRARRWKRRAPPRDVAVQRRRRESNPR